MSNKDKLIALWPEYSYSDVVTTRKIIKWDSWIEKKLITIPLEVTNTVRELAWNTIAASLWNLTVINKIPESLAWVVPIHNTYWKTVNLSPEAVYQLLKYETLRSIWWYSLEIKHILACLEWTSIENLKSIHSHPQAISQCSSEWISRLWKEVLLVNEQSTTTHIPYLQEWEAVICNSYAAENSNLKILDSSFWPDNNITDFVILTINEDVKWLQNLTHDKAMIILSLEDKKGSLVRWIWLLTEAWINMNSIHSQTKSPWNTDFIVVTSNSEDWNELGRDIKKQWWKIKIL